MNMITTNKIPFSNRMILGLVIAYLCMIGCKPNQDLENTLVCDVLIYGSGTGAIASAIQSARSGANTILVSPIPWLGGMMTSAGVSAIDGNHNLPSGLYGEFRNRLYKHYGNPQALATGWVSHTNFEPHIGNEVWHQLAQEVERLTILFNYELSKIEKAENWFMQITNSESEKTIQAEILIDGTDLGDLLPLVHTSFNIGWDQDVTSPVRLNPGEDYIQDLTYCAILKDYGHAIEVKPPTNYDPDEFACCCQHECASNDVHPCSTMLSYAKLPNEKYLLNWPINGNDLYPTQDIFDPVRRIEILEQAKAKTLRFAYYIHQELGYQNLWLADDEFDTEDLLPFLGYYREARRLEGPFRFSIKNVLEPYQRNLYRTGIAVGDYPVDHHHDEYPGHEERAEFPAIPSFTVPLGVIIPKNTDQFLVADKSISVTHEANGTTRLQPVITQIGQAAGALAALSIRTEIPISQVDIRSVQQELLNWNVYLQPFMDTSPEDKDFRAIQRIGSTGLLRGTGIPYQWANQTWFYPDSTMHTDLLLTQIQDLIPSFSVENRLSSTLNISSAMILTWTLRNHLNLEPSVSQTEYLAKAESLWNTISTRSFDPFLEINRRELAQLFDREVNPFQHIPIDIEGNTYITTNKNHSVNQ